MPTAGAQGNPTPPLPAHEGEPQPTPDDPSAGGYYCAARRSRVKIAEEREEGNPDPWPWCRMRAGHGTDHAGNGSCRYHAGNTRNGRASARLRLDELVGPALATLARAISDPNAPWGVRVRAADSLLDRAGYPRRLDIDVDDAREHLVERIWALRQGGDSEN